MLLKLQLYYSTGIWLISLNRKPQFIWTGNSLEVERDSLSCIWFIAKRSTGTTLFLKQLVQCHISSTGTGIFSSLCRHVFTAVVMNILQSAWSVDQGSNKNHSPAYNFAPTLTKLCVMWEGLSLPHDTEFSNCRCKIVDSRAFFIWSLIHGSS